MKKNNIQIYHHPEVLLLEMESEDVVCISGNHEGITFEDWLDGVVF